MVSELSIRTPGQGLQEITSEIQNLVAQSGLSEGICNLFLRHTSASLTIQENADPSAKRDLENWMNALVDENNPLFTHTSEGPDDMPSHIKTALTATSLSIPVLRGRLTLGTWQGIYLWEHRYRGHSRSLIVHIGE